VIGHPAVKVGLPEGAQGEVVRVDPVEECLGRATMGADAQGLLPGTGLPLLRVRRRLSRCQTR
jgi:hypothetical protein